MYSFSPNPNLLLNSLFCSVNPPTIPSWIPIFWHYEKAWRLYIFSGTVKYVMSEQTHKSGALDLAQENKKVYSLATRKNIVFLGFTLYFMQNGNLNLTWMQWIIDLSAFRMSNSCISTVYIKLKLETNYLLKVCTNFLDGEIKWFFKISLGKGEILQRLFKGIIHDNNIVVSKTQ